MGLKIKWKLEVIYDRPRGTNPNEAQITAQDEVFIPKKANGTQPWKEEALDEPLSFSITRIGLLHCRRRAFSAARRS
jgi:hypothetical protein